MKLMRAIGLISLICFTFFYTEKIIDVSLMQDDIMVEIKDRADEFYVAPRNAVINNKTIIPGKVGLEVDVEKSYRAMKKVGFFEESLLRYNEIYPEVSIYNNYNKYIIKGYQDEKKIALIYIINSENKLKSISNYLQTKITFFVDSSFLNNNIDMIYKLRRHEIYNYGNNGSYTKDNLIISNNIINNKANNNSIYCLFLEENQEYLENCSNSKMLAIMPSINGNYTDIKNNITNGSIILINNVLELNNIIRYIDGKGYEIAELSEIIKE